MTAVPKRNDLDARLQRLERAVRDLSRSNVIPLPGPPGPPGPIEGTTIEASVEMLAPLATFDELAVTGDAAIGGTLDAATVQATAAITAPLATVGQLVITGRQAPIYAIKGGGSYAQAVTATLADVGLTANVAVTGTTNKFRVTIVFDIGTPAAASGITTIASDRPIRGVLNVDSAVQTQEIIFNSTARDVRLGSMQQWIVTGLAAGPRTFKAQAALANITGVAAGSAGWYIIRATHTTMLIEQIA